ncbi:MAG: EcsC family protein [Bacteroidota bacterium]
MNQYEHHIFYEMQKWHQEMSQLPTPVNKVTKSVQKKIQNIIPEKVHQAITVAIKQTTRAVIFGADATNPKPLVNQSLELIEGKVKERINFYCSTASVEGAITGAGGIISGLADFPLWLALKMKMLFEIAAAYGYDTKDYKERVYLLHIFQLTFSSQQHRNKIYDIVCDWKKQKELLPEDINEFDWRTFQIEYRDYIDLAKLLQLIPGVGAVVGAYVNHKYTDRLGNAAMNAYRMRRYIGKDQLRIDGSEAYLIEDN